VITAVVASIVISKQLLQQQV